MSSNKFIFDLDGTLYDFDSSIFTTSRFFTDLKLKAYKLFSRELKIDLADAKEEFEEFDKKYKEDVSLVIEKEKGINRYLYFEETWGKMVPERYIQCPKRLVREMLISLEGRMVILTNTPKVWARKFLSYLEVNNFPEDMLITGEGDIRKPNQKLVLQSADKLQCEYDKIYSVGDQELKDIIPAKKLGMKTILVGREISEFADFKVSNTKNLTKLIKELI